MELLFALADWLYPTVDRRARRFGIREGLTVVDYGCGPGRYTRRFAELVGQRGKVYAVDIQPQAIVAVRRMVARRGLSNVEPLLAEGDRCSLPDRVADVTCAIDMFFGIHDPAAFLGELKRITKPDGYLVIDDGHQSRAATLRKLAEGGHWVACQESRDHLRCRPS